MSDLSSLIARLEAAEGPSRGLDAEISAIVEPHLFDAPGFTPIRPIPAFRYDPSENVIRFEGGGLMDVRFFPPVTSSIDAAVSLAERVLPGWFWRCGSTPLFPNGWAHVSRYHADHCDRQDEASCADGKAANVAIALVLATLRALQQKGSSNG